MENPYAAPKTENPMLEVSHAEKVRRELISSENSLKVIGLLYMLGGVLLLIPTGFIIANSRMGGDAVVLGFVFLVIVLIQFFTGWNLRKLKGGARIPAILMSAIGLLGFPIGTLLSACFLYILCSHKVSRVLDPGYQEIIEETPHVKQTTSLFLWVLLVTLLGLIGFGGFRFFTGL